MRRPLSGVSWRLGSKVRLRSARIIALVGLGVGVGLGFAGPVHAAPAGDAVSVKKSASTKAGKKAKKDKKKRSKRGDEDKSAKKSARREALFTETAEESDSRTDSGLSPYERTLNAATESIRGALAVAQASAVKSAEETAKRLVEGQLLLDDDPERAAIIFLELTEGYAEAPAGLQARYFLGEALFRLEMTTWAAECFQQNLADSRGDSKRYHQRSLARLLDLSAPRRSAGFARRPGLSALPELRGRLRALGLPVTRPAPEPVIAADAQAQVELRVRAIAVEDRSAELRYSHGRYLYFRGEHLRAIAMLDTLNPTDIPVSKGGPDAKWRIRAAYLAGVATLAAGEVDDALDRFAAIIKASPSGERDRGVVELAWLARARVHHDRGDFERSLKAYRRLGRASPYYFTAVYESAWVLMRADRFALAGDALERLLALEPDGPLAPEIRQLGGKLKILQGDLVGAEAAFTELSEEFEQRGRSIGATVAPAAYFAAIAGADMEGFDLAAVVPRSSVSIARTLPRANQAESVGQAIGVLDRELAQLRAQLTRMEAAIGAPERVRLFTDLGAQTAGLDRAEGDIVEVMEGLCARAGAAIDAKAFRELESRRVGLRANLDDPIGEDDSASSPKRRVDRIHDFIDELMAAHAGLEAQVVAAEHGLLASASRKAALNEAQIEAVIEMRRSLAELDRDATSLRDLVGGVEVELRFDDPYRRARTQAMLAYRSYVVAMYAAIVKAAPDTQGSALWRRSAQLLSKLGEVRIKLDEAAGARLTSAMQVLRDERGNLDQIKVELLALRGGAEGVVGEVISATYSDVADEIANWQMRSEVGTLDVAWSRKETEAKRAQHLERERDRDQREIDRALEIAEELSR